MSNFRLSETVLEEFGAIVGKNNLLFEEVDCLLYSYDSAIDRALPSAVLFPENSFQISSIVKVCCKSKIPFVTRGAGTNLCGGTIPLHNAIVIAPTKMRRIISIDPQKRIAVVEPGLPNLFLKKALEPYGLFYAPDPASQKVCTIGGNIGTNAGGPHCLKYGVTSHHVLGLEVVLPDGKIVEFNVQQSGYDLTGLLVGSEGTLGIITKATLNLLPIPSRIETMLVSFITLESAIQTVTEIISQGVIPATLEAMDKVTIHAVESFIHAGYPLNAEAVLLIELDGDTEIESQVKEVKKICEENGCIEFRLAKDEKEREKLWEGRRGSYPAMARLAPNVLVEDGAVPRNRLPEALKKIRAIAQEKELTLSLIFHAGDGNLHPQILFDERDSKQTAKVKQAGYEMLKVCVDLGGTISGEHGIGIDKREAMRWLFTEQTLALFRRIKESFDPNHLCNPDKLIPLAEKSDIRDSEFGIRSSESKVQSKFFSPSNEEELCSFLQSISQEANDSSALVQNKKRVFIGGGNHQPKAVTDADFFISTGSLNKIIEHDVENFTVTVQAGIEIEQLQKELSSKNQKVFLQSGGSVGGLIAINPPQLPLIRDQILGMRVALSSGDRVEFGAKVMKNVAGYDAAKLLLGSLGTLGVIISVILKTYPKNYSVATIVPTDKSQKETLLRMEKGTIDHLYQKIKMAFDPENVFL